LLNHTPQEITERVYNLAENLEPRRRAMQAWGDWLTRVIKVEGEFDNIVPAPGSERPRDLRAVPFVRSSALSRRLP